MASQKHSDMDYKQETLRNTEIKRGWQVTAGVKRVHITLAIHLHETEVSAVSLKSFKRLTLGVLGTSTTLDSFQELGTVHLSSRS